MNLMECFQHDAELIEHLKTLDIDESVFFDTLEAEGVTTEKVQNFIGYINKLESYSKAKADEIDRLKKAKERDDKAVDHLKEYMLNVFNAFEIKKMVTPLYTVTVRTSKAVEIVGELDKKFMRVVPEKLEPNKVAIKEAIQSGEEVAGALLVTRESLNYR